MTLQCEKFYRELNTFGFLTFQMKYDISFEDNNLGSRKS